ncbi:MAG: O-antigen ligase family protein [Nitrospirota bacterium]
MIYLGVLFAPLFIYLSISKPFIFPFGAYVFLLPFDSVLAISGSGGATITKLLGIITIFVFLTKSLIEKKFEKPDRATLYWILFIIYALTSFFWAIVPEVVQARFMTAIGLLLLYLVVASYGVQKNDFALIKYFLLAGGVSAALITIYKFRTYGMVYDTTDYVRTSLTMGDRASELNKFAFSLLLSVSISIELLLNEKKKWLKILLLSGLSVIILCLLLNGSRGGLIGVGVIFISYILSQKKRLSIWALVLCMAVLLVSLSPNYFTKRWDQAVETGGSGRLIIWSTGLAAADKYWTVGAGLDNFPYVYNEFGSFTPYSTKMGRGAHNIYLSTFIELGIIGLLLLLLGMITHYRAIRTYDQSASAQMLKAAFWAMLVSCFFLDAIWTKTFWMLWILIMMYRNVVDKEHLINHLILSGKIRQ